MKETYFDKKEMVFKILLTPNASILSSVKTSEFGGIEVKTDETGRPYLHVNVVKELSPEFEIDSKRECTYRKFDLLRILVLLPVRMKK